jgi:uncharacterized membrane protein YpjA
VWVGHLGDDRQPHPAPGVGVPGVDHVLAFILEDVGAVVLEEPSIVELADADPSGWTPLRFWVPGASTPAMPINRAGRKLEGFIARYFDDPLPAPDGLAHYVRPIPRWVEDAGLRLAYPIAAINLVGTLFGFWYYGFHPVPFSDPLVVDQFGRTPPVMWPVVPDSPMATLFIALSLIGFKRGWDAEWLHMLAFFGCIKLGLWTPFVQAVLNGTGAIPLWMWHFLVWSHLAMAVEAFLIHRYSDFPVGAVALAAGWYLFNDVVDYLVAIGGGPHHTDIVAEWTAGTVDHAGQVHDLAAAAAVVLTVVAVFLALATRVEKLEAGALRTA